MRTVSMQPHLAMRLLLIITFHRPGLGTRARGTQYNKPQRSATEVAVQASLTVSVSKLRRCELLPQPTRASMGQRVPRVRLPSSAMQSP
ncbi:hypothetical protein GY45DRAFT_838440 [Cubamyces sp. BRFM 1775]|nr:hypothetical protein GY45DRAFT_838440 [Cubamyces sp. BRFM 1775]